MRITAMTLQNYRGFAALPRRAFHPELNVLVGENGTGKTALLDALAVGVGSFFLGVDGVSARGVRSDDVHLAAPPSATDEGRYPQYPLAMDFEGEVFGKALAWSRELRGARSKLTNTDARALAGVVGAATTLVRDGHAVTLPLLAFHGTGRLWMQKKSANLEKGHKKRTRFDAYSHCLEAASDEKAFLKWFKQMEWAAYQERAEPLALCVVREAARRLVPGCVDLRFRAKEGELIAVFDDGRRLPTRLLSDGFRTMLGLVCDLAWRCTTLNPALGDRTTQQTPGVVLIDEIDLHLHPNWQRRVLNDLRSIFPKVQFFVTTHSPFIVQSVRSPQEVVALSGPQHLDTAPDQRGIEEVAEGILGVDNVARSERFLAMQRAAEDYLATLDDTASTDPERVQRLHGQYVALAAAYAHNPAFLATLRAEAALRGVRVGDEPTAGKSTP